MKKSTYFITGFALLAVSVIFLISNYESSENDVSKTTLETKKSVDQTGTPADNHPPNEREQHCGSSDAKSNQYVQEFEIPTPCTQPLSITVDSDGKIWFTQTNTGNLAVFDSVSKNFTEYKNEQWDLKQTSMMWGIFYTQDDEVWFTDEAYGALWKFSISEKTYSKFSFTENNDKVFPQKIEYYNDHFLINDFTGNQIIIVNHDDLDANKTSYSTIKVPQGFFTSQVAVDNDNLWFVMWKYQKEAILIKTNFVTQKSEEFSLPSSILAPNGVSIGPLGNIWIADTGSSSFYKFNSKNSQITEYVTSDPPVWSYGNSSGLIKTPITRPYWNLFDSEGNMWFNEHAANRLAVFDPKTESLLEYDIPSKNPKWADCGDLSDCGISQTFGFANQDNKIWFTSWVENNIGVLDSSVTIPISLDVEQDEIQIKQGEQKEIKVIVMPQTNQKTDLILHGNTSSKFIKIKTESTPTFLLDKTEYVPITISVDENTPLGYYKILIGTQLSNVSVSSYATIKVI